MGRANEHTSQPAAQDFEAREQELLLAHRRHRPRRYRSLVAHWLGRWLRRPRAAKPAPLPRVEPGQVSISFAGHATVLIRYANRTIVCDPMLGSWVRGAKRAVTPGLTPADLHDVNLILISHGHSDHLHRPTLAMLPKSATVVLPPRTAHRVSDMGFARVVELSPGKSLQDHDVDIATAAVRHDDDGLSYVIRGHGPSVYFCGDSGYCPTFAAIGGRYRPDIAILPIGGYAPLSFRERHMSPLDALYALEDLGARIMIPIHHGAFALSYEELREPGRWLAELVRERELDDFVVELAPGESRVFVPPRPHHGHEPLTAPTNKPGSSAPPVAIERAAVATHVPEQQLMPDRGPGMLHPLPALRAFMRMQPRERIEALVADSLVASFPVADSLVALPGMSDDADIVVDVVIDGLSGPMPALA